MDELTIASRPNQDSTLTCAGQQAGCLCRGRSSVTEAAERRHEKSQTVGEQNTTKEKKRVCPRAFLPTL